MQKRIFYILRILLMLLVVSESRPPPHEGISPAVNTFNKENGEEKPVIYTVDRGVNDPEESPDYDDTKPGKDDNDGEADNKPEIIQPNEESDEESDKDVEESDDKNNEESDENVDNEDEKSEEGFFEPFDSEKDSDESIGGDTDSKLPSDEASGDAHSSEEEDDQGVPEEEDKKESGEEDSENNEDDEEMSDEKYVPKDEEDDEVSDEDDNDDEKFSGESGFFGGGSIFRRPFFGSLYHVRKYFKQMEKALGHVFRETINEALLLNGTYANTTEEEVVIKGKKYIVQKSIIKGADNHSSIYVETLSSKRKWNDTRGE